MSSYSLTHLSDQALLADLVVLVAADRHTTAALLAHIAEVDARALYLPAACSSMHVYCMRVLHLAEDVAFKRLRVARAARRFPPIFPAIADGRLHVSGVVLLAPHLTDDNADELLAAASYQSKAEIELLLAQRWPRPDVPTQLEPQPQPAPAGSPLPQLDPGPPVDPPPVITKVAPLAPQRFALQVTIDQATQEKLLRAQALLRHRVPSGELAQVLDLALDALLATLTRQKFGATAQPRKGRRRAAATDARYVPNDVKRAVHARDGEQCTFVSEAGDRCGERGFLEIDHRTPVARGGEATVANARLLCSRHNAYEAERVFGAAFMQSRRMRAPAAGAASGTTVSEPVITVSASAAEITQEARLGLRGLGFTAAEADAALARSAHLHATTLEQRLRVALAELHSTHAHRCSEPGPVWQPSGWRRGRVRAGDGGRKSPVDSAAACGQARR